MTPTKPAMPPRSWSDRLLIILWTLIPISVVGVAIFGRRAGELLGAVAFSLLPAALMTVVAKIIAITKPSALSKWAKAVWWAMSLIALFAAVALAGRPHIGALADAETLLIYVMLVLSFPCGLLAPPILMAASPLLSDEAGLLGLVGMWLVFFAIGFLQWFYLLPAAMRRWKAWRRSNPRM